MFVQSERFVLAHGGQVNDLSIYGQESNPATWRLCKMNLAIRGIKGNISNRHADTFHEDLHKGLKAEFVLANPPFNVSDWGGEYLRDDPRWKFGTPPTNNANFAWVQHIVHHLSPSGVAGFVLSNGSLAANQGRVEGKIRTALIESDLIDCIVALPSQLFYNTQIAASLWFIARDKEDSRFRNRRGETLFIYANHLGHMVGRIHRELIDEEISRIASTYHAWRNKEYARAYKDTPGFCKSATIDEIRAHKMALVPGRYVGFERSQEQEWDSSQLYAELTQLEERLNQVNGASRSALTLVREMLDG